jgi:hypothetical protein
MSCCGASLYVAARRKPAGSNQPPKKMLIDSTQLMYAAFMEARWAMPATGSVLEVLDDVLDVTIQQQALVVTVPDEWLTRVDDYARHLVFAGPKRPGIGPLAGSDEDLFTLVRTATTELRRLWSIQATEAVRALGHVMHNIPEALWDAPDEGSAIDSTNASMHGWHPVTKYWSELSVEMRLALSRECGLDLESAQRMLDEDRE